MRILLAVLALAALVAAKPDGEGAESAAGYDAAAVQPPSAAADKPVAGTPADPPASPRAALSEPRGGVLARLDRAGVPRWAWAPILVLMLAFLRLIFRRGRRSDDLMGPPPSMRRTGSPRPRRRSQ